MNTPSTRPCPYCGEPTEHTGPCAACAQASAVRNAQRRARYAERKAAGLCVACADDTKATHGNFCEPHFVQSRLLNETKLAKHSLLYAQRKAAGQCVACTDDTRATHGVFCAKHHGIARERRGRQSIARMALKTEREIRLAQGRCTACGADLPADGRGSRRCEACRATQAAVKAKVLAEARAAGVCIRAGCTEHPAGASNFCMTHWTETLNAAKATGVRGVPLLIEKWDAQGARCFYTGRPLIPGVNASIDHIWPQATHPELANHLDNMVWADSAFNYAKRDMTLNDMAAMMSAFLDNLAALQAKVPSVDLLRASADVNAEVLRPAAPLTEEEELQRKVDWYADRRAKKLCVRCRDATPATHGVFCERHSKQSHDSAAASRARKRAELPVIPRTKMTPADGLAKRNDDYARRKAAGLCVRCTDDTKATHGVFCAAHGARAAELRSAKRDEAREYNRRRRQRLADEHRCTKCMAPLDPADTHAQCPTCRVRVAEQYTAARKERGEYRRERKERLVAEHRCIQCTVLLAPDDTHSLCPTCREKAAKRVAAERAIRLATQAAEPTTPPIVPAT